jgi:hypothetical protein
VAAELTERRRVLAQDQTGWEASLAERSRQAPATHVLEVVDFDSEGDAPHKLLDDGSVLLVDDAPDRDTYTVVCHTQLTGITGFKLETLTDPSLPGQGPGRGDDARPNFVLNTISLTAAPMSGGSAEPVELVARATSFEQKNFTLAGAVDSNPKSGWAIAPKFHEPHWATFVLRQPLGSKDGTRLVFTLVQQFGAGRTIGRLRLSALTGDPSGAAVPADVLAALHKPAADRTVKDRQRLADYSVEQDPKARTLVERQQKLQRSFQALARPTTLVMQELPEARTMHLFTRGDFRAPGEAIEPGVPGVLHPLSDGPRNRLALARWLVDRDNPLVARVVVNRWWAELFGQGLVTTLEDFGIQGERPTHPELLDWLAVEFMDGGWSMKRLLRTIVTSATYRQSSSVSPALLARDDRNLLYARGPRFRLPAEAIRDSALTAAGLISLAQGGPPIRPYQPDGLWTKVGGQPLEYVVSPGTERWRRGVYVVWKRASPYPSFMNFDATSRLACTVRRSRSNTPLQALTLLNDPSYVEAAWGLVRRVDRERGGAPLDEQLRYAFRVCLARSPTPAELAVLMKLHADQRAAARAEPESAKTLVAGAGMLADRRSIDERAAWYAVATTLLNLDETITKN